jgi:hypothetical protein
MPAKSDVSAIYKMIMRIRQVPKILEEQGKEIVLEGSLATCRVVKNAMPVDTGRAKAGWGQYTPDDLTRQDPKYASSPSDAVWVVSPKGWSIQQGTNVPYTKLLNAGHSQQAPAGFIDRAVDIGVREMLRKAQELRNVGAFIAGRAEDIT